MGLGSGLSTTQEYPSRKTSQERSGRDGPDPIGINYLSTVLLPPQFRSGKQESLQAPQEARARLRDMERGPTDRTCRSFAAAHA